jgi:hypothetical protein
MGEALFVNRNGEPLISYLDPEPAYRRNTIGFMPPEARETHVSTRSPRSNQPVETCACCSMGEDAEAIAIDLEDFEEEEP